MKAILFICILPASLLITIACNNSEAQTAGVSVAYGTPDSLTSDPKQLYSWPGADTVKDEICTRFYVPEGFKRTQSKTGSFGMWLRHLPLLRNGVPVMLHNGEQKRNQNAHIAVLNIDVGKSDLQQCADAVMRLRAEYLFSCKRYNDIAFNFTNGDRCIYTEWCDGIRINTSRGGKQKTGKKAELSDHEAFRRYMNDVFMYAGTLSLSREMKPVYADSMRIGDVFIKGGSPGHACIVADMAVNEQGEKVFLLLQSYMPAQQIHVLKNPEAQIGVPWYPLDFGEQLVTPEWKFSRSELMRF
ncbi:MAG: DUF4846 domain-containing protein [Bacteroidota bacterium]|jgi:hypothetical protein